MRDIFSNCNDDELEYFNEILLDKQKYDQLAGDVALITSSLEVHSFNSRQNKNF